jgi:hypothetical protein
MEGTLVHGRVTKKTDTDLISTSVVDGPSQTERQWNLRTNDPVSPHEP